jgi:glycosyltransferase involved in cell wall biosynthesis
MAFERKKVLVMTDSAKIDTGFGRVGREVWSYLFSTGKYEVHSIGWFHQENARECPYPIYTTKKNERGMITQEDKYAHKTLPQIVDKIKPDLVWTLGDMWMTDHVKDAPNRNTFKWMGYFPIDGQPSPSKWGPVVENMDYAVAYGAYGMNVIKQRAPKANLDYIYHGVNTRLFRPHPPEARKQFKSQLLGLKQDKTVIGIVARNQPRKAFDSLFKAYYHVLNGEYVRCKNCDEITVSDYDVVERKVTTPHACRSCGSKDITKGKPKDDIILYLHCAPKDCGWDLIDLQADFDLKGNIIFNPEIQIGRGVAEGTLAAVYNAIDIFTLPTRGEGFGLPILEAMSSGIPVIATDYSAHPEWCKDSTILIPPKITEAEPLTNIRRAIIDMDEYVKALLMLIENESMRKKYGELGRKQAEKMDWSIINRQWEKLVDSALYPEGVPERVEVTDMKFKLEEI